MSLPELPLVVLDTETTGFIPRVNRVIEFASMRFDDGRLTSEYEQLISIPVAIPATVSALTRITDDDLKGQPSMDEIRETMLERIGKDTIIVGQNVSFDLRMLKGEGIDLTERAWIDTSMLASLVFPELESYSLSYVSQVLNLDHTPVHRALGDVRATAALLTRCWERLQELSPALREPLDAIMHRAPEGYRRLFAALPDSTATQPPAWLGGPAVRVSAGPKRAKKPPEWLAHPSDGVQLVEAPLDPEFLPDIMSGAGKMETPCWIALKNVHATVRTTDVPAVARVLQPASSLFDREAVAAFAAQPSYTADEATLALKIAWYEPVTVDDFPIHGGERDVWKGKLAATPESASYRQQFENLPPLVLLNHWQLLSIAAEETHPAYALLPGVHIIIDDASMLEDTATKAYGWQCVADHLRAAAEGDAGLTKFTDLFQIWMERTRHEQDVRYLTAADVTSADARALREQAESIRAGIPPESRLAVMLDQVMHCLDPKNLPDRIAFIETRQDGSQSVESVPSRVGDLLRQHLYDRTQTTLLIPPGSGDELAEILPPAVQKRFATEEKNDGAYRLPLTVTTDRTVDDILESPPEGKTVVLMSSRGRIEDVFIRKAVEVEARGITLICQNLSGGMGRMQAEFCAAPGTTIWVLTPWSFETVELPPGSIDHLAIDTLPFDHPAHTILSKRSERYRSAFMEYTLPRVKQRLYRLLRTFGRYRSERGGVTMLDKRLEQKEYGREIAAYLQMLTATADKAAPPKKDGQLPLF